jgi:two-component system chemotaxis response regulator CheB
VAVTASAGGVEALCAFVASLPAGFPAAVLVVLHIPPAGPSVLPSILARAGKLPARHPSDREALAAGVILVAPPDRHLVVSGHEARLLVGPTENGHRPSGDVLLRSVAETFGARGAGVVLSGTMDDGAAGLRAVRAMGGFALVQDPGQAAFPNMPLAAIEEARPQVVGPVETLAGKLCDWLARLPATPQEITVSLPDPPLLDPVGLTPMTCPECGGTVWLHDGYGAQRFRCRAGHTFSVNGMLLGKQSVLERALWTAVVALEERADLSRRICNRLAGEARAGRRERYRRDAAVAEQRAASLRHLIRELLQETGIGCDEVSDRVDSAT